MTVVGEYYALRSRAVASDSLRELFARHPDLAHGEDRAHAVNVDAFFVERMRNIRVQTVITTPEEREPVRVFVKDDRAVAFVHGREEWIESGTALEFHTRFDLRQTAGSWSIERTDEVLESEWPPPPTPR